MDVLVSTVHHAPEASRRMMDNFPCRRMRMQLTTAGEIISYGRLCREYIIKEGEGSRGEGEAKRPGGKNYFNQVVQRLGNQLLWDADSESDKEEEEGIPRVASSMPPKFSGTPSDGKMQKKRTRNVEKDEYYDLDDPFIDDGELDGYYEQPEEEEQFGGFYVNEGEIEAKKAIKCLEKTAKAPKVPGATKRKKAGVDENLKDKSSRVDAKKKKKNVGSDAGTKKGKGNRATGGANKENVSKTAAKENDSKLDKNVKNKREAAPPSAKQAGKQAPPTEVNSGCIDLTTLSNKNAVVGDGKKKGGDGSGTKKKKSTEVEHVEVPGLHRRDAEGKTILERVRNLAEAAKIALKPDEKSADGNSANSSEKTKKNIPAPMKVEFDAIGAEVPGKYGSNEESKALRYIVSELDKAVAGIVTKTTIDRRIKKMNRIAKVDSPEVLGVATEKATTKAKKKGANNNDTPPPVVVSEFSPDTAFQETFVE